MTYPSAPSDIRQVEQVLPGRPTHDGAGVKLLRVYSYSPDLNLDPFLMLDEFSTDEASDYIGGFPDHPHRGFETVTYMLDGRMLHQDHMGNSGDLGPGDVQWMTAGRGVIHSEMPQQTEGRMHGFQLWINLPSDEKMCPPAYRDIPSPSMPVVDLLDGSGTVKVIAGTYSNGLDPISGPLQGMTTAPLMLDVHMGAHGQFLETIAVGHTAFVYVYEGEAMVGDERISARHLAVLGAGAQVQVNSLETDTRFLVLAAAPIGEPVVQYGPFVMNTRAEIEQAVHDYQAGKF
ncbi:COG1741 Pirin-related protein [Burkholderiaceae bacterium]